MFACALLAFFLGTVCGFLAASILVAGRDDDDDYEVNK